MVFFLFPRLEHPAGVLQIFIIIIIIINMCHFKKRFKKKCHCADFEADLWPETVDLFFGPKGINGQLKMAQYWAFLICYQMIHSERL